MMATLRGATSALLLLLSDKTTCSSDSAATSAERQVMATVRLLVSFIALGSEYRNAALGFRLCYYMLDIVRGAVCCGGGIGARERQLRRMLGRHIGSEPTSLSFRLCLHPWMLSASDVP